LANLADLWNNWSTSRRREQPVAEGETGDTGTPTPRRAARARAGNGKGDGQAAFPAFLASAIDRPLGRTPREELVRARLLLRDIFTPTQPVTDRSRFAGRLGVLAKLIGIIEEQRSHVVIYGERGIGKTSLMHILADIARESHYIVAYASCGATSRFDEIFRAALREVPMLYLSSVTPTGHEAESGATLADRLPQGFDARQLGELCAEVTGTRVLILLDEYDRIQDTAFRQSVAELIKNLSDRAARVQLVIAGVASNLQELTGYIPSIRRNVIGLPIPRLSEEEVRAIIGLGETSAGVRFDDTVIAMIGLLSNGSPYLARLLSHHASMKALDEGRMDIRREDISRALDMVVEEAEGRISRDTAVALERLLAGYEHEFLGAAARAASTADGWFAPADVLTHLPAAADAAQCDAMLEKIIADLRLLESDETATGKRYRFVDEALPTYLWMKIARDHVRRDTPAA
jgi:Cdc6-like AAA superfamily ATPase